MKKLFRRLRSNKGFSLVECIMAIALFALMSSLALGILAGAIARKNGNNIITVDMNEQMQKIASGEAALSGDRTGARNWAVGFTLPNGSKDSMIAIDFSAYSTTSDGFVLSKPDYDMSYFEATLIKDGTSRLDLNTTSPKVYCSTSSGNIVVTKTSSGALAKPVSIGGVDYSYEYVYEISFSSVGTKSGYVLLIQLPTANVATPQHNGVVTSIEGGTASLGQTARTRVITVGDKQYMRVTNLYKANPNDVVGSGTVKLTIVSNNPSFTFNGFCVGSTAENNPLTLERESNGDFKMKP